MNNFNGCLARLCVGSLIAALATSLWSAPPVVPFADIYGEVIPSAKYSIPIDPLDSSNPTDLLNGCADRIEDLRVGVIKFWLNKTPAMQYPDFLRTNPWPTGIASLEGMLNTTYYRNVLNRPTFKAFSINITEFNPMDRFWRTASTQVKLDAVKLGFHNLTLWLMRNYQGTGKPLVLTNWEGDNALSVDTLASGQWQTEVNGMIAWLDVRQEGVNTGKVACSSPSSSATCSTPRTVTRSRLSSVPALTWSRWDSCMCC